jgi:hypothetical protein
MQQEVTVRVVAECWWRVGSTFLLMKGSDCTQILVLFTANNYILVSYQRQFTDYEWDDYSRMSPTRCFD